MWKNNEIQTIKWNDFFGIETNKMIVYRITPHSGITNNTNKEIWSILHQLYSIYHKVKDRRTWKFKGGFKCTLREKDTIWFDVVFRNVKGQKKIEFYASTTETWSKKFKEVLEDKMKATLTECSIDDLQVPEDSLIQDVKYLRNDIFSMKHKYSEQTTPIGSIMSAVDDVTENGDFARLSICNETEDRKKWANYSTWGHEKVKKGKTPQRHKLSPKKALNFGLNALFVSVNEVLSVLSDTLDAVQNTFGMDKDEKQTKVVIENPKTLENEIGKHNMSDFSHKKRNDTVWLSRIRVAAKTSEKLRTDLLANTISSSFSEIADDNELQGAKIRFRRRKEIINEMNTMQLSPRTKNDPDVNRISSSEMGKIALQLPTSSLQKKHEDQLNVNRKVETYIPNVLVHKPKKEHVEVDDLKISVGSNNIRINGEQQKASKTKEKGLLIGHSELKGKQIPIGLPINNADEFYRGYVFQGGMGMGKDTALQNFIAEGCLKHGISYVIPDVICEEGRRGLANGVRDALPPEKVIDLDFSNEDYIPPLDITEIVNKLGKKGANRFASEMIDFMNVEDMIQSKRYLRTAAKASGGSLFLTKQIFEDYEFRQQRIEELREEGKIKLANELEGWGDNEELGGKVNPLLNRLDDFFGDETLEQIFTQPPHEEMNFEQWIKEGKAIIIRIPNGVLSELATKVLFHWITLKVFMTRLLMSQKDRENGLFMVFNEPHQYMTEGLRKFMTRIALEGRKMRMGSLFAFHHIGKIPHELAEDLKAGGVNWFLFANDHKKTFEMMKEELNPTFEVEAAMNIEKWHAICIMRFGGRRQHAFLTNMMPPPRDRYTQWDNSFLTKRHSRMYGRHWQEIEHMTEGA